MVDLKEIVECFFFVEEETVRSICVKCKMENNFEAWFYNGKVGPWDIKCYNCGKVVHSHKKEDV